MRHKVAIVTATRAEYGILRPLIFKLNENEAIELQLVVTGTHLEEKYGNTQDEIIRDGISITRRIPILEEGNSEYDISIVIANAIRGFSEYFRDERPELVVVLGDRTEMLGVCTAAMTARIPIAHLHGGEITEGAVDDCVRHAISKMSYLHFPANETYRNRIIQMGESPDRVFNVGALGVENILNVPLLSKEEICTEIGIDTERPYVVVTFHPVTLEGESVELHVKEFIQVLEANPQYYYLITKANADAGGDLVNELLESYAEGKENIKVVASLGMVRYLSALKYAEFALGNSSSGIIEAPALGVPTVNIGNRQKGRLMASTIINCDTTAADISKAMKMAQNTEHIISRLYGDGNTSDKILEIIKDFLINNRIDLRKKFYDIAGD